MLIMMIKHFEINPHNITGYLLFLTGIHQANLEKLKYRYRIAIQRA